MENTQKMSNNHQNFTELPVPHYPLRRATLIRIRWLALSGQTISILFVAFVLKYPVPLLLCLPLIGLSGLLNFWLLSRPTTARRLTRRWAAAQLAYDSLQLAALLWLTGGLENPFALLLLAPVSVSATILPRRQIIIVATLAVLLATLLAVSSLPLPWDPENPMKLQPLHIVGIWVALLLGIIFVATYSSRVAHEARQLADALAATELALSRQQHLSALDGLAAAAAHELGTPLSTIALASKEMLSDLPEGSLKNDVQLIFEQSTRCRTILAGLRSLDDENTGPFSSAPLSELIGELTEPFVHYGKTTIIRTNEDTKNQPRVMRNVGLLYGLGNLIENAVQFARSEVTIETSWSEETVEIIITDDGPGFAAELINHLGEPYLTTRVQGQITGQNAGRNTDQGADRVGSQRTGQSAGQSAGLGLGIFIAKTLLERTGAAINFSNVHKNGHACIVLTWPRVRLEVKRTQ